MRLGVTSKRRINIIIISSASEAFDGTYPTNVVVTHEGQCTYIPPGIFMSTCKIDITWFPFDDQNCEMKFGSWTYNGFKVGNVPLVVELDELVKRNNWDDFSKELHKHSEKSRF